MLKLCRYIETNCKLRFRYVDFSKKKGNSVTKPLVQTHTPSLPGTLTITNPNYGQNVMGSTGQHVFGQSSFPVAQPGNLGPVASGFDHNVPMFPNQSHQMPPSSLNKSQVASHSNLPQQPSRPSATATAAPLKKNSTLSSKSCKN